MAFVYETIPEKDYEFFNSMRLPNPVNKGYISIVKGECWCADRERNAYIVCLGGGMYDMPYFIDLWWNGCIVEMLAEEYGKRVDGKVIVGWRVVDIPISSNYWDKKDIIISIIKDGLTLLKPCGFEDSLEPQILCECRKVNDKF